DKMTALSNATAFRLARPLRQQTSVIFSSPHSGRDYPQAFLDASPLAPLLDIKATGFAGWLDRVLGKI
ncbi:MAG: hypothetical protein RI979_1304, partial [Pseudomonadota bacterium]